MSLPSTIFTLASLIAASLKFSTIKQANPSRILIIIVLAGFLPLSLASASPVNLIRYAVFYASKAAEAIWNARLNKSSGDCEKSWLLIHALIASFT